MIPCPLKEAARDAPNAIAILSKEVIWTFEELDRYVDQIRDTPLIVPAAASPHLIALFFAAWRKNGSIFPINPRLPQIPHLENAPPQSLLLFTSGSTAAPKIAVLTLSQLLANASNAIAPLDLRPNDQWRLTLPLYHVGGIGILLRCVLARATIVLDDSPNITHLSYIPTHLYRATPVYKQLRCLLLGGAPITSYPAHLPVYTTYGLTEMGSMVTLNGKVLPGRELQIADDGEIFVRGECLFAGYLKKTESGTHTGSGSGTKKCPSHQLVPVCVPVPVPDFSSALPSPWFPTKDLGHIHNNHLTILGRKDWMFISGGENIQPEEIERELMALPQVIEAVVLPVDDAEFGKRPVAVVKANGNFDLKQMQVALRDRLPKYKIPIALHLVDELPQKNNLKVDRFILSQLINSQHNTNTSGQKNRPYL
ncbi:MAG TPA: AMP-binding protein [Chlamydiales bacterium]|nr:AMP-binding protein [Chlamydiales bacterium]